MIIKNPQFEVSAVRENQYPKNSTGHTFNYDLNIRVPKGYIINWNEIKDTLSKSIEVISRSEVKEQPIDNSSDILSSQILTLSGHCSPPIDMVRSTRANILYAASAYREAKDL